jgi:hypothetical protein
VNDLLSKLDGWKTYLAAAAALASALYALKSGDYLRAQEFFIAALGLAGLRHALVKAPPAPPPEKPA